MMAEADERKGIEGRESTIDAMSDNESSSSHANSTYANHPDTSKETMDAAHVLMTLFSSDASSPDDSNLDTSKEVSDAADSLMRIYEDGVFTMRRLMNRHHGNLSDVTITILQQAAKQSLTAEKTPQQLARDEAQQKAYQHINAALTLLKLNGQDVKDTLAALALVQLRKTSTITLWREQQRSIIVRKKALQQKKGADKLAALAKFHKEYPAVLATSTREAGTTKVWKSSRLREEIHNDTE